VGGTLETVLVSWSGGKDSCLALYKLLHSGEYRVAALLTTVTSAYDRVQMHGVRRALLERQAASLGLPLRQVPVPAGATNEEYERATAEGLRCVYEAGSVRQVNSAHTSLTQPAADMVKLIWTQPSRCFLPSF